MKTIIQRVKQVKQVIRLAIYGDTRVIDASYAKTNRAVNVLSIEIFGYILGQNSLVNERE